MIKRKDKHWQSVFEDFEKSGVSKRQYCVAKDIPLSRFHYYWSKLRSQRDSTESCANSDAPSGFVPVVCTPPQTTSALETPTVLSFTLPNKICCELSISDSTDSLTRVLSTLVAI